MKKWMPIVGFMLATLAFAWPTSAHAEETLVALVTEETADPAGVKQSFWWQSAAAPAWSPTDVALGKALRGAGVPMVEPSDASSLSKIYRRPSPTDANAVAMATVFGRGRALVGTIRYESRTLSPLGLTGWRATAQLRLVEQTQAGVAVLRTIDLSRSRWASLPDEAQAGLRSEIADAVAMLVAAGLKRNVGPVGLDEEELMIGVAGPSTRAALDAVRAKLGSFAGVTEVRERWAAEGIIVIEVNPGAADPRASVEQYISLLTQEGAGRWSARAVQSRWPNVVVVELAERTP